MDYLVPRSPHCCWMPPWGLPGISVERSVWLSITSVPSPLTRVTPLILNVPDPRGPQDPAGVGFVAGMRWTPANRVRTGIATPPGSGTGHLRQLLLQLAESPALQPGLHGPVPYPDPQCSGLRSGSRRCCPALPAVATGLRSALGAQGLEVSAFAGLALPRFSSHPSTPQSCTSSKAAPKLMMLVAASLSTSPKVAFWAGGLLDSRGSWDLSSLNLWTRYS